jgi:hypothetical protein
MSDHLEKSPCWQSMGRLVLEIDHFFFGDAVGGETGQADDGSHEGAISRVLDKDLTLHGRDLLWKLEGLL